MSIIWGSQREAEDTHVEGTKKLRKIDAEIRKTKERVGTTEQNGIKTPSKLMWVYFG